MVKYLSGKTKRVAQDKLGDDRYKYLDVANSEPNLGDPASPLPGVPVGQQYNVVSVRGHPGERYWAEISGGLIPGSVSVYDEGSLVGTANSITQLDFRGVAIAVAANNLGIAATITVSPPGANGSLFFKESNDFATDTGFTYDNTSNILNIPGGIKVGASGTVFQSTPDGRTGIGTTNPTQELHVQGDVRISGTIYDSVNSAGNNSDILVKSGNGMQWLNQSAAVTGAGGSITQVQFHSNSGLIDGADTFVYISSNGRVGIGSTQPNVTLDVKGDSVFLGPHQLSALNVTGVSTFIGIVSFRNNLYMGDNDSLNIGDGNDLRLYHDGQNSYIDDAGIGTIRIRGRTGVQLMAYDSSEQMATFDADGKVRLFHDGDQKFETNNNGITVNGLIITNTLTILESVEFDEEVRINKLKVTGVGTIGNIEIAGADNNEITTISGNLKLDSQSGTVQVDDLLYVNNTTQSTGTDSGSFQIDGGAGIDKNLNVGGMLNVVGISTFVGVGTFKNGLGVAGSLLVGGNLEVIGDVSYDEQTARNQNVTGVGTINVLRATTLDVSGLSTLTDNVSFGSSAYFGDNGRVIFGNSEDLSIYHNGTNNFIDFKTNNLFIRGNTLVDVGSDIHLQANMGEDSIVCWDDQGVSLFYDGNERFETTSSGINVTGVGTFSQDLTVGGGATITNLLTSKGNTILGNSDSDTVTFNADVNSHILPSHDATGPSDASGKDIGSISAEWRKIYAREFVGAIVGNADSATKLQTARDFSISGDGGATAVSFDGTANVNLALTLATVNSDVGTYGNSAGTAYARVTVNGKGLVTAAEEVNINFGAASVDKANKIGAGSTAEDANHFLTFVDSNNGSRLYEEIYTDSNVMYNPSSNLFTTGDVKCNHLVQSSGGSNSGRGSTGEVPVSDGNNNWVWGVPNSGGSDKVKVTSKETSTSNHFITFVDSNNSSPGSSEDVFTDSALKWTPTGDQLEAGALKSSFLVQSSGGSNSGKGSTGQVPISDGSSSWSWGTPTAGGSDQVKTQTNNNNAAHYLTFVDSNNTSPGASENVYTDAGISYNPSDNKLTVTKAKIDQLFDSANSNGNNAQVPVSNGTTWEWGAPSGGGSATILSTEEDTDTSRYIGFVEGSGTGQKNHKHDDQFTYNPSSNLLTVGKARITELQQGSDGSNGSTGQVPISDGTNWSWGTINLNSVANLTITANTDAVNKDTGALIVQNGGVGIEKNLRVGQDIYAFSSSDIRLKDNITPISEPLSKVLSLSGNTFDWNEKSNDAGEKGTGVIAQEVEALGLPGVTTTRDDGMKAVKYDRLVPLLIEAIKELKAEVDELKSHKH